MKKVLYIRPVGFNDNSLFVQLPDTEFYPFPSISFDAKESVEFNIDWFISERVIAALVEANPSAILLPISLTNNFFEFVGLRLAYHIRLSNVPHFKLLPIVFISDESTFELIRLSELSYIIGTNGCYLTKPDKEVLSRIYKRINENTLVGLDENYFSENFLDKIILTPPANYQSHHSIANEWSIIKWSENLNINDSNLELYKIKQNTKGLLYYKYLLAKYPDTYSIPRAYHIENSGKILYIDDEWEKGWGIILQSFIDQFSVDKSEFKVLTEPFKSVEDHQIIQLALEMVKSYDPDIIVLDLRLTDNDFNNLHRPEDLTGCKILKEIKKMNPGFQVIVFTASNKVWNLLEIQKEQADGFILKEGPEHSTGNNIQLNIENLAEKIDYCFKRVFLKDLNLKCSKILKSLNHLSFDENPEFERLINKLKKQIGIAQSAANTVNLDKPISVDLAFMAFFNYLELFKDYYLYYNNKDYRYNLGFEEIPLKHYYYEGNRAITDGEFVSKNKHDKPSWLCLQIALYIDYFQIGDVFDQTITDLSKIATFRNDYIHSSKLSFEKKDLQLIIGVCFKITSSLKE